MRVQKRENEFLDYSARSYFDTSVLYICALAEDENFTSRYTCGQCTVEVVCVSIRCGQGLSAILLPAKVLDGADKEVYCCEFILRGSSAVGILL